MAAAVTEQLSLAASFTHRDIVSQVAMHAQAPARPVGICSALAQHFWFAVAEAQGASGPLVRPSGPGLVGRARPRRRGGLPGTPALRIGPPSRVACPSEVEVAALTLDPALLRFAENAYDKDEKEKEQPKKAVEVVLGPVRVRYGVARPVLFRATTAAAKARV